MKIQIEITEAEYKTLSAALGGDDKVLAWVTHSVKNKARKRMDAILTEITDRQPGKMSDVDRETAIMSADLSGFRKDIQVNK